MNGTLYSLLGLSSIRHCARSRGLDELLRSVAARSGETFARQINYIMEQLMDDNISEPVQSDEDIDDETNERGWDPQVFQDENDDIALMNSENGIPILKLHELY